MAKVTHMQSILLIRIHLDRFQIDSREMKMKYEMFEITMTNLIVNDVRKIDFIIIWLVNTYEI
jgi:hypothetical protein